MTPGFDFTEAQASELVKILQSCIDQLGETVIYADAHCSEDIALPYKKKIAKIMADLGWDVLEQGFYKKYPQLRPLNSSLRK